MERGFAIAFLLACAAVPARAGLGVFANGVELSKNSAWTGSGCVQYDPDGDVFVVRSSIDRRTKLPELTLSGTNLDGDVAFVIRGESGVMVEDLRICTAADNRAPFKIDADSEVILFLSGENEFKAEAAVPGLQLGDGASLVITNAPLEEEASLVAVGGADCAGIGAAIGGDAAKSLTIAGGVIEAQGNGWDGCGIGASEGGSFLLEFVMTGGTVEAYGGRGSGFYAGYGKQTSQIITGGSFNPESWFGDPPRNTAGSPVRQVVIRNPNWDTGTPVKPVFLDSAFSYGCNSLFACGDCIFLWLPDGNHSIVLNGVLAEVRVSGAGTTVNLATPSFAVWCERNGIAPVPDGLTAGQPNILRYAFDCPDGPLPMPTFDLTGTTPVAVMPYLRHVVSVSLIGCESLSDSTVFWRRMRPSDDDPTRWPWDRSSSFPQSLFIRYKAEY